VDVDLPAFDGDKAAAKINVMLGQEHTAAQKTAWDQIVESLAGSLPRTGTCSPSQCGMAVFPTA
jgi:hypothetical protein